MLLFGDLLELPALAVREIRGDDGATWPTHEVIMGKPRRQFMGPTGQRLTISIFLHVRFLQPTQVIEQARALAATGQVFQLWTRAGAYLGTYFIESVSARPVATLSDGRVICAYCDLQLSDPGLEQPEQPARPEALDANAQDTVNQLPLEDLSVPIEDISPEEIARV